MGTSPGHPARQDPDVRRLHKAMTTSVELVRDLQGRLSEPRMLMLKSAALGMMYAYAEIAGMPDPDIMVEQVYKEVVEENI